MGYSPLLHNLIVFARLLRSLGLRVTSGDIIELTASLAWIDIGNREDFRAAARCLLVTRHEEMEAFDRAFEAFWRLQLLGAERDSDPARQLLRRLSADPRRQDSPPSPPNEGTEGSLNGAGRPRITLETLGAGSDDPDTNEGERPVLALYSAQEALRGKDFALFSEDEIADARRFMGSLHWELARRRSRRVRPSPHGRRLDLRRSLRRSLRHGGELIELAHRGPKVKRRNLVLLCDISGSMERYTRLLLHFLYSVEASIQHAEVFLFGTRLTRITRDLRRRDPDRAIQAVTSRVHDWSGGTRIGESLRTFNRVWARRVLGQGAIVLVISDGWDRGDPTLLSAEMERLQRASYRLIWLNPLLGSERYRPLTQGIQAALPYVDSFLPVHNLHSLESLAGLLNVIQHGRPDRRQGRVNNHTTRTGWHEFHGVLSPGAALSDTPD